VERRHGDVLIAGLILVGAALWLFGLVRELVHIGDLERIATYAVSGFVASQVARRVFVDLELATTVIATGVATAIAVGIFAERRAEAMHVGMLLPIGAGMLGAVAGSVASRARRNEVRLVWRIAAVGFASIGSFLLASGVLLWFDEKYDLAVGFIFPLLASLIVALRIEVEGRHAAIGVAVPVATIAIASNELAEGLGGVLVVGFLAALGATIGARIRRSRAHRAQKRAAEPELPHARAR
jgi:hypothetical protein